MTTPARVLRDAPRAARQGDRGGTARADYWSPYPESPSKSVYGEDAAAARGAAFRAADSARTSRSRSPGATGTVRPPSARPYGIAARHHATQG